MMTARSLVKGRINLSASQDSNWTEVFVRPVRQRCLNGRLQAMIE
jgi:hypothetical protein